METFETIVIGSRASELALAQAAAVEKMIKEYYSDTGVEIKEIITKGDQIIDKPFHEIDGKGLFLKELEKELLAGEIDLAVHSLKDVPTELPAGLELLGPTLRLMPGMFLFLWSIIQSRSCLRGQLLVPAA